MKIWLFQIGEPLPLSKETRKMRTALLAEELAQQGHQVVWWASQFDHNRKAWLEQSGTIPWKDNIEIVLLRGCGYSKNISLKRFYDHRLLAQRFREMSGRCERPDLIVAAMPSYDLSYQAALYANCNGVPIFVDVRDQWPDIFLEYLPSVIKPLLRLVLAYDFYMLKQTMRRADGLISMMQGLLDWGLAYAGRKAGVLDRVFYLGNSPHLEGDLEQSSAIEGITSSLEGKFVVTFIGSFTHQNNPEIIARVASRFASDDVVFVIAGDGVLRPQVEQIATGLENVILPGWLNVNDMRCLLDRSSVGIIPSPRPVLAFPNKAFVYLSAGLPIVTSCHGDLLNLLKEYGAGTYYEAGDEEMLFEEISGLIQDEVSLKSMKHMASKLFADKLNAEEIYPAYADFVLRGVEELSGKKST